MSGRGTGQFTEIAQAGAQQLESLVGVIHEQVYRLYHRLPTDEELGRTWYPVLRPMLVPGIRLELVTTNYDLVLETALDRLSAEHQVRVDTGWRGSVSRYLDVRLWERGNHVSVPDGGMLTKLHGSVNWSRGDGEILVGDSLFKGSHKRHVIVYPGFKGQPSDRTFQTFHNLFANALASAAGALFVGFAFRDEHISELCRRNLPATARVGVIDPRPDLALPFPEDRVTRLGEAVGFDSHIADEAARLLTSSVDRAS